MKFRYLGAALAACLFGLTPANAAVRDLEGSWDNQRLREGGLAELDIVYDGGNWKVRGRAACRPRACDLGEQVGYTMVPLGKRDVQRDASGVSTTFEASDAQRFLIIQTAGADRLEVTYIQSWRDGRPAAISKETMVRADRGPGPGGPVNDIEAQCADVGSPQIRYSGGAWVLAASGQAIASFDTPDEAGYARWVMQSLGMRQKCTIAAGGFEYWTTSNSAFPKGAVEGEYCSAVSKIRVKRGGGGYRVQSAGSTLYQVDDEEVANAIAQTLVDNNARSQCVIGERGRGLTYFKR